MRQHTIITYSYNELNEKGKEKAHNKVEEIMTDLINFWKTGQFTIIKNQKVWDTLKLKSRKRIKK